MYEVIDMHIHLLPGIDDGPPDMGAAIQLARAAYDTGTRVAIATPHLNIGHRDNYRSVVVPGVEELSQALAAAEIDLAVKPGAEVRAHPSLVDLHKEGELPTLADNGIHLLLELPWSPWPSSLDDLIFNLRRQGLEIIIAHPERYPQVQKNPEIVYRWVDQGLMMQLNGPSLAQPRSTPGRLAHRLLQEGVVHFIGSDGHSASRPPDLGPLINSLINRYGEQVKIQAMENAAAIVAGAERQVPPITVAKRRWKWLSWLR